jgi:hypothetical protein
MVHMSVIPKLRRLRQGNLVFGAHKGYMIRLYLKKQGKKRKR